MAAFGWLSFHLQLGAFIFFAVASTALMIFLARQGKPLITPAAPRGIGSFEFAWNEQRANKIIASWKDRMTVARVQLLVDYPFLIAYPCALSLSCGLLAKYTPIPAVGFVLSWIVLLACPLDATEDACLLVMLRIGGRQGLARLATLCAAPKFALAIAALVYTVVFAVWLGIKALI